MRYPINLSGNYSETRRPQTEQRCVNMYPHTKRGFRQFPGLVQFSNVSNTASLSLSYSVNAQNSGSSHRVFVTKNGLKMYEADGVDTIWQYSLDTPFRVDSAIYDSKTLNYDSCDSNVHR